MGLVRTKITLINTIDAAKAKEGLISKQEIRKTTVNALVDTGSWTLVINETVRQKLGLEIKGLEPGVLADGNRKLYNLAGPLHVKWKNRSVCCEALVVPGAKHVLLGAIQLDAMDLKVHPRKEEVVGAHGDEVVHLVY